MLYRLVEEADYKNTAELFASKKGDAKSIDTFIPKSESDFIEYAELISSKLRPFEVYSICYIISCGSLLLTLYTTQLAYLHAEKLSLYGIAQECDEIINDIPKS